jgi:polyisoprenoid-binding protein YceI
VSNPRRRATIPEIGSLLLTPEPQQAYSEIETTTPTPTGIKMTHKSVARFLGAVWVSVLICTVEAQAWQIDETGTTIGFAIRAVGFLTTHGRFTHYRGRLLIDFDQPAKSYTAFTIDATSVEIGSPSFNNFVKSPALLNVERFPTMNFASTQVEKVDGHTARVTGDLTLLGVTKPLTLTVEVIADPRARGRAVAFVARGPIQRSDFGMNFGGPLIDDTLEITVKTRALSDE